MRALRLCRCLPSWRAILCQDPPLPAKRLLKFCTVCFSEAFCYLAVPCFDVFHPIKPMRPPLNDFDFSSKPPGQQQFHHLPFATFAVDVQQVQHCVLRMMEHDVIRNCARQHGSERSPAEPPFPPRQEKCGIAANYVKFPRSILDVDIEYLRMGSYCSFHVPPPPLPTLSKFR